MTILENEYLKVGRNNLDVPLHLVESAISLQHVKTLSLRVVKPFNCLYTFWKPSHFFTGLEVHSPNCSWRSFRVDSETFTAAKMIFQDDEIKIEIYANKKLTLEQVADLQKHIISSYGLDEGYELPQQIIDANRHVSNFLPMLYGTRISCPEYFFEISIVSLLLQNTNISRTTSMFRKLIEHYGKLVLFDGMALFSFYSPEDVLTATEEKIKENCRLGYRAKYIRNYADFFSKNSELELRKLGKEELLSLLETIKGVGKYTSNIVASSALRDTKAIPFDSWNRKILASRLYDADSLDTEYLRVQIEKDFGEFSGLIAMYVIENEYIGNPVVPLLKE